MSGGPGIVILGSTGSIGRNTVEVVEHLRRCGGGDFPVRGLAAGSNVTLLAEQARRLGADNVAIADPRATWTGDATALSGKDAAARLVREFAEPGDIVLAAIVGAAGIDAVLAGVERGCRIALANKESLVAAGAVVMPAARAAGVDVLPVDSEHSAIFQCLHGHAPGVEVERLVLTASGGPFRGRSRADIEGVTVDQALAHPTWNMGPKVTIDSATLANKALEVMEAHWLFDLPAERIDAIVHPQSIIHGFVEFVDGSVLAQAGPPDMRTPIQVAITWPERCEATGHRMDWQSLGGLQFEPVDHDTFPMIRLAWNAIRAGGTAGAVLNAANEVAVETFLHGGIRFADIFALVADACEACPPRDAADLSEIINADVEARGWVRANLPTGTRT